MAVSISSFAQNLALMISNEANFLSGVPDQARSLCNEISLMTSALHDASYEKRRTRTEVKEWLNQVRDAVMEAEDVIDFFIFAVEQQRHRNFLTRYICYPNQLYNLHNLGRKIENSNKKINQLSVRRSTLGLATSEAGQSSVDMITNKQSLRLRRGDRIEEFVIGFKKEENLIAKKLLIHIEPPRPCPTVVSIVGMGGSGKTTLARNVFKRNDVKEHFPTRAWISVSQQYRIKDLLLVIIEQVKPLTSMEKKELDSLDIESLIHWLSSHLKETTYLIVLDDLWSSEAWDMLKQAFPVQGESIQSRVLITTRNETVARYANPATDPYHQRLLNEDESWELFLTKVIGNKDAGCLEDLEDLGRKIVDKCHRLPLAIVVLGSLLSIKPRTHVAWSKVLDSVNWELNQHEGSCKQALTLSYTELPDHLKPCFLYVGLFPEDYEIPRYKLIWLWMAEGFIQPRGHLTMEDVAEDYLEELIQRSMIKATVRNYDGRVISCHVHDLVRDLAISEAKQERFLDVLGGNNLICSNKSRRLFIMKPTTGGMYDSRNADALNQGTALNHLRSLLYYPENVKRYLPMKSLNRTMKLLRVLDLEGVHCSSIPLSLLKQIGKLVLLKYLSLRYSNIEKLPSSIGDLHNLQTLDLRFTLLRQLPMTIMKLHQLRNLVFHSTNAFGSQSFDCPLDHMTNLQTLVLHEGKWIEGRLDKLTNLRELRILSARSLSPYKEELLNAIPKLNNLRGLSLVDRLKSQSYEEAIVLPTSFSDHLQLYHMILSGITGIRDFPLNLTTLFLGSQRGQGIDDLMATLKKLPKLRCLILTRACMGSKIIFSADGFPQLEELLLIDLDDLEEFTMEAGALPNLKVLKIKGCGLKRLPCGLKQVVTLQELTLSSMSKELEDRVQKDIGEDWEIIKNIPSIETQPDWRLTRWSYAFGQWC